MIYRIVLSELNQVYNIASTVHGTLLCNNNELGSRARNVSDNYASQW